MKRSLARCASLLLALALPAGHAGAAGEKPLWEIGAGISALTLPAYRGSDQTNNFILPVPFFTYHGDFFKADRHGIRGSFFDTDRIDMTVSLALSPPMGSDDIPVRAGMPDLKA
ncbi:MAG: MipA/OmpV family protein, partial [Dechloromonas sp.]|nr:MipA/OmpV family protein [Dechloromonas sp.]